MLISTRREKTQQNTTIISQSCCNYVSKKSLDMIFSSEQTHADIATAANNSKHMYVLNVSFIRSLTAKKQRIRKTGNALFFTLD